MSFITPEDAKKFLVVNDNDTANPVYDKLCSGAYAMQCLHAQRTLICPATTVYLTETHEVPRGENLYLNSFPIVEVSQVYPDDDSTDLVAATDYQKVARLGRLWRAGGWLGPDNYWTVKYRGGFQRDVDTKDWQNCTVWQLTLVKALWNDTGLARKIFSQQEDNQGLANFVAGVTSNAIDQINQTFGDRYARIYI